MGLSRNAIAWALARGISVSTLAALGVVSGTTWVGDREQEVIAFPYKRGKQVINCKYRSLEGKEWRQEKNPELRFWNLDAVLSGPKDEVYIVEGEMDAMALVEAGVPVSSVLSVPNGAPQKATVNADGQDRYKYVEKALEEGLGAAKRFILAGDSDDPGHALREDLIQLLGAARCWFVDWPEGIKDANEGLIKWGSVGLADFLRDAPKEWPVRGLYRLSELPEPPPMEIWRPGFVEWENKLQFAPRTVSVCTGYPGHGKTVLMMQLWYQMCRDYDFPMAVASFETRPKPHHRRNILQFMFGKPLLEMTEEQRRTGDEWIENHIYWAVHPHRRASLRWLLDMGEIAVVRYGCRAIKLDPWNKMESDRPPGMNETDYIGQCIDECLDFAIDMNCHLQIIAHPAKPMDIRARTMPPTIYDIAGSAHWNNKIDLGLSVFRPKLFEEGERKTEAELYVQKAKYEELGFPCQLNMDYVLAERRYKSIDYATRMDLAVR